MDNRKQIEEILLNDYGCFDDFTVDNLCDLFNVSQRSEQLEALKGIERECDNQNPTHENIWRIANGAIKGSNCG